MADADLCLALSVEIHRIQGVQSQHDAVECGGVNVGALWAYTPRLRAMLAASSLSLLESVTAAPPPPPPPPSPSLSVPLPPPIADAHTISTAIGRFLRAHPGHFALGMSAAAAGGQAQLTVSLAQPPAEGSAVVRHRDAEHAIWLASNQYGSLTATELPVV